MSGTSNTGSRAARHRSSSVYNELRRGLLLGEYALIERLAEVRLAERFGASRTPVREALMRLESEGLVHRRPEGGFYPRSPNLAYVRELYELRRMIELGALERPSSSGIEHDRATLTAIHVQWSAIAENPPDPDPDFVALDEGFHVGVAAASGNSAFADHLQLINERIRVVRMQDFLDSVRIEVTAEQHVAIVVALLDRRVEEAVGLMASHLDEARQQASARAAAAIERMMTAGSLFDPESRSSW